jgi:hypothetical protein
MSQELDVKAGLSFQKRGLAPFFPGIEYTRASQRRDCPCGPGSAYRPLQWLLRLLGSTSACIPILRETEWRDYRPPDFNFANVLKKAIRW